MNDYNSKSDWYDAPQLTASVEKATQTVWGRIRSGYDAANVHFKLPDNQLLWLTVHVINHTEHADLYDRSHSTALMPELLFEFHYPPHPCQECRGNASKCRVPLTSADDLNASMMQVVRLVYEHGCLEIEKIEAGERVTDRKKKQPIRIHGSSTRVKLLNAGETSPKGQPTITRKTRNSTRMINPSSRSEVIKTLSPAPDLGLQSGDVGIVGAPTIRYRLSASVTAEVTVPYYICRQLIEACSQSNHHGREVGGVLIGHCYEQTSPQSSLKEYKTIVTDILPIQSSDSSSAHIRLDEEAWINVIREFDAKYGHENKVQLGWYHTHPTQGIFFSTYDLDVHTIFRQPFQIALVVDPQIMEAGLFYWKDYNSKSLADPIRFPLDCERENGASSSINSPLRGPIARLRTLLLGLFGAIIAAFAWREFDDQNSLVTPDQACLLPLFFLIGLRLWNANVFHPVDPIETLLVDRIKRYIIEKFQDYVYLIRNQPAALKRSFIRALIMAALGGILTYSIIKYRNGNSTLVNTPAPSSSNYNDRVGSNMNARRVLFSEIGLTRTTRKVILRLSNSGVKVEYLVANSNSLKVVDEISEKAFFNTVFGLRIEPPHVVSNEVRRFQKIIDIEDSAADGRWGDSTRNAFIRAAMRYGLTEQTIRVPTSNDQHVEVIFEYKP